MKEYNDDSISQLKGAERVRKRPEVMLGTSDIKGTRHTVIEILGNALDEGSAGFGDRLIVTYYKDTAISIRDFGRGVPLGYNEKEKRWNWDLVYNELYAGGKYDDSQEVLSKITDWDNFDPKSINYLFSVGLNGLGAASVQYSSEYFEVKSYRDGKCSRMYFEHGVPALKELEITDTDEPNGTFVKWLPDKEVFTHTDVDYNWLCNSCEDVLDIAGLDFTFINEVTGERKEFKAGGIESVLSKKFNKNIAYFDSNGNPLVYKAHNMTHGIAPIKGKNMIYVCVLDLALTFTKNKVKNVCFHNSTYMDGGSQYNGIQFAIEDFFTRMAKERGIKLDRSDYEEELGVVVSSFSNVASYKGQTKNEIDNSFIYSIIYDSLTNLLNMEYGKGNEHLLSAIDTVMTKAENRIRIKEYAKQVKQASKVSREKPEKFASCRAYDKRDASIAELWIGEGDSAVGAIKEARDSSFQAVVPIIGKTLNVLKQSMDRILSSSVIKGLFALIGTGMDLGHENLYDESKLRFDKIIFATDADEDGYHIRVLLFLIFYKLAPDLLRHNHVFIAETPLFGITYSDGSKEYAYDLDERNRLIEKAEERGLGVVRIDRYKGLGEAGKDVLRETTVSPEHRKLVPLTVDVNNEQARKIIQVLFGVDKFNERKEVLTQIIGEDFAEVLAESKEFFEGVEQQLEDTDDGVNYVTV